MNRLGLSFLFLLSVLLSLSAQQSKQVYITLDVSGSMNGDKYVLANYTTQMIVTLCDDADDVHMIVYGQEKTLSKEKNPLAAIQRPIGKLSFGKPSSLISQFEDIIGFNNVYRPSKNRQNWLFIIGDGIWGTFDSMYSNDLKRFENNVKSGELNVCYLQTGQSLSEHSDFTQFAESLGLVDIRKSSTAPETILKGCDHFAKKILGFSETSLDIKQAGTNAINVTAELPISEFLLVYQDEVYPESLPKIANAQFSGQQLHVSHKGTPTTKPLKDNRSSKKLSGNVWLLKSGGVIPANTPITIAFDKKADAKKVNIYPLVKAIEFGSFGLSPLGEGLKQIDSKSFAICENEETAVVRIELSEDCKDNLPEQLLQKTQVTVKANNKDYAAKYKNGGFECVIDLTDEKTQYYAECDCPGYFHRVTPIMTIVKEECEPASPPVKEQQEVDFGTMTFQQLKDSQIKGVIQDSETLEALDPNKFDISLEIEDDFMYEEPSLSIEGNTLVFDVHPKGDWCECLFPTDLKIKVVSTPKPGAFNASDRQYVQTVHPIRLSIVKDRPWLSRCFWVIVALILLLLFTIYLRALMKKKRFKKNAMMTPKYYTYFGDLIEDQGGTKLRREGFGAWCSRWLLPGDERTTVSFDKPFVSGLTLIAAESKNVVNLLKSSCNFDTMDIAGYDPETDTGKTKTVKIGDRGIIEFSAPNGTKDGEVIFSSGSEDDGAGYRLFLGLLMAAAILAICLLIVLMVKSL